MADKKSIQEPVHARDHFWSSRGLKAPELKVAPAPPQSRTLPEAYGQPALELLVVDPENVFVSWEITGEQLEQARLTMGAAFDERKLLVELVDIGNGQSISTSELFGEVGRWFIPTSASGCKVKAILRFEADGVSYELNSAGPVKIPRVNTIEPTTFDELHVSYKLGPGGQLILAGSKVSSQDDLPQITYPRQSRGVQPGSHDAGGAGSAAWVNRSGTSIYQGDSDD